MDLSIWPGGWRTNIMCIYMRDQHFSGLTNWLLQIGGYKLAATNWRIGGYKLAVDPFRMWWNVVTFRHMGDGSYESLDPITINPRLHTHTVVYDAFLEMRASEPL